MGGTTASNLVRIGRGLLASGSSLALLFAADPALAQTALPQITVQQPKPAPKPAARRAAARRAAPAPAPATPVPVETPEAAAVRAVAEKNQSLNEKRDDRLLTK